MAVVAASPSAASSSLDCLIGAEHSPSQEATYFVSSDLLFLRCIDFYDLFIALVCGGSLFSTWAFSGCGG